MKKIYLLYLLLLPFTASAQFITAGDGSTYTIQTLSYMEDTGIMCFEREEGQPPVYLLSKSITIGDGDRFVMDDGVVVQFDNDVVLTIKGEADFALTNGSTFDSAFDCDMLGAAIVIKSPAATTFKNCHFSYVGLEMMGEGGASVRDCSFEYHDGSTAAALYFVTAGAESLVEDCYFECCAKAAIGSASNASQPLTIRNCTFVRNSAANGNVPQINITAANPLTIEDCTVTGNPDNNMVGGIGISNFMSYDANILISGCTVEDNRYGIGLVGPAEKIFIENCTLRNNKYETNPMNGGSGVSLYDPYLQTHAYLAGNHIEGNLWGVTVIGCQNVSLGNVVMNSLYDRGGNVFQDNGNGGVPYDLYNNSANTVYAQNNTWSVSQQTEEMIETVIYHKHDDPSLGEVIYWPAATETGILQPSTLTPSPYYDLRGRQLDAVPEHGIYIRNGKKIIRR